MKTIDRYIGVSILKGFCLVLLVLVILFSLADLVRELDDVGRGHYKMMDALVYVGLRAPRRAVALSGVSALLGTILALGAMAARNELVALRGMGSSVMRIAAAAMPAAIPLMLVVAVSTAYVVPDLEQMAATRRSEALSATPTLATESGFWFRDGLRIVRVMNVLQGEVPADLRIYEFDQDWVLRTVTKADSAEILKNNNWLLHGVEQKSYLPDGTTSTRRSAELPWRISLSARDMGLILSSPESLSPADLLRQIRRSEGQGQARASFELVLWGKIAQPFALLAMMFLGVPFVFGQLRSASQGRRLALGSLVGVTAYFLTQVLGFLGVILDLSPAVTALTPVVLMVLAAVALIRTVR